MNKKLIRKGQLGLVAKLSPLLFNKFVIRNLTKAHSIAEISSFIKGTKPMIWAPFTARQLSYLRALNPGLDTFKGHHYGDFVVNRNRLMDIIDSYKPLYTHRLGLSENSTPEFIYDYLKLNSPTIFNGAIDTGRFHDLLGISLGFGPKDALVFAATNQGGGAPSWIDRHYNGVSSSIPSIVSKAMRLGRLSLYHSTINGDHMGYHINDFKSELDWTPESWLGKRPEGAGGYTSEEADALARNVPEYLNIEKEAKENGTWLKLEDGSMWEGDPREWVMMLSKNYKNFMQNSKLQGNYTHESNNWQGTEITPHPAISGKLFGDGLYVYRNPTGKDTTKGVLYTQLANQLNPPTAYNLAIDSRTPIAWNPEIDRIADIFSSSDRNSPARVGSFHYPLFAKYNKGVSFDPRLENDALILDGAWKGKNKVLLGFPNGLGASPSVKFVTGNTGEFNRNLGIFRSILPYALFGGATAATATADSSDAE